MVIFWKVIAPPCTGGTGMHSNWLYPKFKLRTSDRYCKTTQKDLLAKTKEFAKYFTQN